jgi:allantoinase
MVTGGDARLPHGRAARVAVSFVLNYEEGGERNVLDGDAHAENYLVPEVVGLPPIAGRSRIVEDLFEYGSRAGFWRVCCSRSVGCISPPGQSGWR